VEGSALAALCRIQHKLQVQTDGILKGYVILLLTSGNLDAQQVYRWGHILETYIVLAIGIMFLNVVAFSIGARLNYMDDLLANFKKLQN
jgi:hypothetical protein